MAITTGDHAGQLTINVTPLIDVLLVLLIIFMVIVPTQSKGLPTRIPQEDNSKLSAPDAPKAVVLTVIGNGDVMINRDRLRAEVWPATLRQVLSNRADRTVFLTAAPDSEFRLVGEAIDIARSAGASQVGLLAKPN